MIQVQHNFFLYKKKKKKLDDATLGPENNHQILASFLISFQLKKKKLKFWPKNRC